MGIKLSTVPRYDQQHGMVAVDSHVTGVLEAINELSDGRIAVYYNTQDGKFDVVEHCLDGLDRLITSVDELDQRLVDRLRRADQWRGTDNPDNVLPDDEDFLTLIDKENEALEAQIKETSMDKIRDAGERLARAFRADKTDGVGRKGILVPRSHNANDSRRV